MSFTPINPRNEGNNEMDDLQERISRQPVAIAALGKEFVPSRRWRRGLPQNEWHYWDEPVTTAKLPKDHGPLYPLERMDLSDAWIAKIVSSEMSGAERARLYPAVFSTKNLRTNYINKGHAGKTRGQDNLLRYQVVFGVYQMHGDEGAAKGFSLILANTKARRHGNHELGAGLLCENQTLEYDFAAAAKRAQTVCDILESKKTEAKASSPATA